MNEKKKKKEEEQFPDSKNVELPNEIIAIIFDLIIGNESRNVVNKLCNCCKKFNKIVNDCISKRGKFITCSPSIQIQVTLDNHEELMYEYMIRLSDLDKKDYEMLNCLSSWNGFRHCWDNEINFYWSKLNRLIGEPFDCHNSMLYGELLDLCENSNKIAYESCLLNETQKKEIQMIPFNKWSSLSCQTDFLQKFFSGSVNELKFGSPTIFHIYRLHFIINY